MVKLAHELDWDKMELEFQNLYSDQGRPSIPIRKIAGLLLLREMFKESDESVVERWIKNPYWQYFTGEIFFQNKQPFDPSEFVHFRKRLQESGDYSDESEHPIPTKVDSRFDDDFNSCCHNKAPSVG